ncbi:MAG: 50S ribosome-binding GTPase [Austwickia sp.]|nr:MAG: 50S ribosome-binding GTPase [Austwickia sp.]
MRRRERHAPVVTDPSGALKTAVEGLTGAIDAGGAYLPPTQVAAAEKVLRKASERLALSGAHTVVALAGSTGAGKSSLFNALVGAPVSQVGALRPTTSRIAAAVWGDDDASALLDWVDAQTRHHVAPEPPGGRGWARLEEGGAPAGLVLLDLPDIDSFELAHRAEADRVLALADVFVWVTDPQKYADALLHDHYLRRAARHQAVTLVVLNQADRMSTAAAQDCREDLRRLLADDGLPDTEVMLLSAKTGEGVFELREALAGAARAATAARARLLGDVQREADALTPYVGASEPTVDDTVDNDLLEALSRAAGIPIVLDTVAADYRRQATARVGWPFSRWVHRLRPDPLRKLRLQGAGSADAGVAELLGRSSLPQPTPAARAAVDLTTRKLGARAGRGLPSGWARAVEDAATPDDRAMADALDRAVLATPLRDRNPLWWAAVGFLQLLLALVTIAGLGWLLVLAGFAFLKMPSVDVPTLWSLPVPTVMLVGGILGGLLLALLAKPLISMGAARRRSRVAAALREQVRAVAAEHLIAPVRDVLDRHRRTREALTRVRSS